MLMLSCRRALTAVYQLHAAAINSICVGKGLALTASDDAAVRLWPLNFASFLLEAQHEAPVTFACFGSADGLQLVAGCEDGGLGQLDVVKRQHTVLLRSHSGAVQSLAVHPTR
jgi:WD40 repeat protein